MYNKLTTSDGVPVDSSNRLPVDATLTGSIPSGSNEIGTVQMSNTNVALNEPVDATDVGAGMTLDVEIDTASIIKVQAIITAGAVHTYKVDLIPKDTSGNVITTTAGDVMLASASAQSRKSSLVEIAVKKSRVRYTNESGGTQSVRLWVHGRRV